MYDAAAVLVERSIVLADRGGSEQCPGGGGAAHVRAAFVVRFAEVVGIGS